MDRFPSDNLDNLLLALAKLEYRDFVGVKPELAKSLIEVMKVMEEMLEYELKARNVRTFMPMSKQPHKSDSGAWPNG